VTNYKRFAFEQDPVAAELNCSVILPHSMGKAKGKKGGRKTKGPAFYTSEADLAPFGFKVRRVQNLRVAMSDFESRTLV